MNAVTAIAYSAFDVVIFTARVQVDHLMGILITETARQAHALLPGKRL